MVDRGKIDDTMATEDTLTTPMLELREEVVDTVTEMMCELHLHIKRADYAMDFYTKMVGYLKDHGVMKPTTIRGRRTNPNMRRAPTGYILFGRDARVEIKKTNPDMSPCDIMSEIGRRWRHLPEDAKKDYVKRAAEQQKREE